VQHSNYGVVPPVRANLVQDAQGAFTDSFGSSRGISTTEDRELLLWLRSLADVVVTDGETARLERYRIPLVADLAVISRRGYTPEPRQTTHRYLEFNAPLGETIRLLQEDGYKRILLEVGPGLLKNNWQKVDQLCLTTTGHGTPTLLPLAIDARRDSIEQIGESTFTVWSEIRDLS